MQNRAFSTTRLALTPPKYKLPTKYKGVKFPDGWSKTPVYKRIVTPNIASHKKLSLPPLTWTDIMASIPTKTHSVAAPEKIVYPSITAYYRREQDPIRFLQRDPLPTTFPPGHTLTTYKALSLAPEPPLSSDPELYPYTYYRVTLQRGLIGLEQKTKAITHSLGLHVRGQVVYKRICASTAGKVLAIKELVAVKLVNTIPPIYKAVQGYTTIENVIGKRFIN